MKEELLRLIKEDEDVREAVWQLTRDKTREMVAGQPTAADWQKALRDARAEAEAEKQL